MKFLVVGVTAGAAAEDEAAMGIAIGISDEAPSSEEGATVVATTTGGTSGASRAGELPEGAAIEGRERKVAGGGARKLRRQGKDAEGGRRHARWEKRRELEDEVRGEALFKGCLKGGKNGIFTTPALRVFRE